MCSALLRGRAALALASVRWTPPATLPPRLQQRRCFAMLAAPTPLLRCSFSWEVPLTIPQLRERLRCQQRDDAPRMQTIETECCLILTLARSPRAEERAEALESGEALWVELQDPASPLPMTSQTGVRMSLCTAMRRCALVAKRKDVAEIWTERFAQRHNIRPEDFTTGPNHTPGEVLGWRKTRPRARPGTGIDDDDIEADAQAEEEASAEEKTKRQLPRRKEESPLQQFRHEVFLDHPMMQQAFKRGVHTPGPRYTGD